MTSEGRELPTSWLSPPPARASAPRYPHAEREPSSASGPRRGLPQLLLRPGLAEAKSAPVMYTRGRDTVSGETGGALA